MKIKFKPGFPLGNEYHGLIDVAGEKEVEVADDVGNALLKKFPDNFKAAGGEKAIDKAPNDKMIRGAKNKK